jgi:hypothetical protein
MIPHILLATGLALLARLALRFGHDSRDALRSAKHELARLGMRWDVAAECPQPAPHMDPRPVPLGLRKEDGVVGLEWPRLLRPGGSTLSRG